MAEKGETRDPSSHRTPGQIKRQDAGYNHRPIIIREREMRNKARAMIIHEKGKAAVAGKDVDHRRPVRAKGGGGTNAPSNLRIRSRHANRGWERD